MSTRLSAGSRALPVGPGRRVGGRRRELLAVVVVILLLGGGPLLADLVGVDPLLRLLGIGAVLDCPGGEFLGLRPGFLGFGGQPLVLGLGGGGLGARGGKLLVGDGLGARVGQLARPLSVKLGFAGAVLASHLGPAGPQVAEPLGCASTGQPLSDTSVLSAAEVATIKAHVDAYNAVIAAAATANGAALVDANAILKDLAADGLEVGGITYSSKFLTGGVFGYHGVHPTAFGYAHIADQFIAAITPASAPRSRRSTATRTSSARCPSTRRWPTRRAWWRPRAGSPTSFSPRRPGSPWIARRPRGGDRRHLPQAQAAPAPLSRTARREAPRNEKGGRGPALFPCASGRPHPEGRCLSRIRRKHL